MGSQQQENKEKACGVILYPKSKTYIDSGTHEPAAANMFANSSLRASLYSPAKQRALEDAANMQKSVLERCKATESSVPPYHLTELIGKGSYGRVYKAKSLVQGQVVAVKIIDIDHGDFMSPRLADTCSDLLKEIKALKLLSRGGARNINLVIDAIPVGQAMWVVTEYCAGGSVSTLMKPTPGGLQEKWIIPILREIAVALRWVHAEGIIHRDVKGANILITEQGQVQLCDFGVAGMMETNIDKRSTLIGTPHWMAPELFDKSAAYGTEVDIWAFGAMAYELASGRPPNVVLGMNMKRLRAQLRHQAPRLYGDQYSAELKGLVSYCMQRDIGRRPNIAQLQRHRYINNTQESHPTGSLSHLVRAFKMWEAQGGQRQSLFTNQGVPSAAAVASHSLGTDWNFSTTASFDKQVFEGGEAQEVYDVYGEDVVDFGEDEFDSATLRPASSQQQPRHVHPSLPKLKAPIEKVFDPNTVSTYEEYSRFYYSGHGHGHGPEPSIPSQVFLPPAVFADSPRDARESLIDLDAVMEGRQSRYVDLYTLRYPSLLLHDIGNLTPKSSFAVRRLSDPADTTNARRRLQDWKFPLMTASPVVRTPTSAFLYDETLTPTSYFEQEEQLFQDSPTIKRMPSDPILSAGGPTGRQSRHFPSNRLTVGSLRRFDLSFPEFGDYTRPSTPDLPSIAEAGQEKDFAVGVSRHITFDLPVQHKAEDNLSFGSSPSSSSASSSRSGESSASYLPELSFHQSSFTSLLSQFSSADLDILSILGPDMQNSRRSLYVAEARKESIPKFIPLGTGLPIPKPAAPSDDIMEGEGSHEEVRSELKRLARSLSNHLSYANSYLSALPVRKASAEKTRKRLKRNAKKQNTSV